MVTITDFFIGNNTNEKPSATLKGMIRYNNDKSKFESCNGTEWTWLGGVINKSENTYITAEEIDAENKLQFYIYYNTVIII